MTESFESGDPAGEAVVNAGGGWPAGRAGSAGPHWGAPVAGRPPRHRRVLRPVASAALVVAMAGAGVAVGSVMASTGTITPSAASSGTSPFARTGGSSGTGSNGANAGGPSNVSATADVAVIQLTGASGLTTATIGDSSTVTVGQGVVAIGNAGARVAPRPPPAGR
jgi:hypothetical protein